MQALLTGGFEESAGATCAETVSVYPGTVHTPRALAIEEQAEIAAQCFQLGDRPAGRYTPVLRSGSRMSLQMLCLGRHWNARTYAYEASRSDHDGLPAPELPDNLREIASRLADEAGMPMDPDVCIVNYYSTGGRLGLHQDRDERRDTLEAGTPIVSLSIGDAADFLIGGRSRRDPTRKVELRSGDAVVFGGPSRLRFHGISRIHAATAPRGCGVEHGRINLTFRQGAR